MAATCGRSRFGSMPGWLAISSGLLICAMQPSLADTVRFVAHKPVPIPRAVGFFDYMIVDVGRRRIVAAHTQSDSVVFLNADTSHIERQVYLGAEPHGVALDARTGSYFIGTSGAVHGVFVIGRDRLENRGIVLTPGPVDALTLDTRRDVLYADADDGNSIWVVSVRDRRVIGTIQTPRDSDKAEYDPDADLIYQNFTSTNSTLVFDPSSRRVVRSISTLPATKPHGLVVDPLGHSLFVAGVNGVLEQIDLRSFARKQSLTIAPKVDQIAIDTKRRRLYCASAVGALSIVDIQGARPTLLANLAIHSGARTLAVDPVTGAVWVSYGTDRGDFLVEVTASTRP